MADRHCGIAVHPGLVLGYYLELSPHRARLSVAVMIVVGVAALWSQTGFYRAQRDSDGAVTLFYAVLPHTESFPKDQVSALVVHQRGDGSAWLEITAAGRSYHSRRSSLELIDSLRDLVGAP